MVGAHETVTVSLVSDGVITAATELGWTLPLWPLESVPRNPATSFSWRILAKCAFTTMISVCEGLEYYLPLSVLLLLIPYVNCCLFS